MFPSQRGLKVEASFFDHKAKVGVKLLKNKSQNAKAF